MREAAPSFLALEQAKRNLLELTPPQALILSFVALSLVGTLLLKLPIATHQPTTWMQALFTAVSAATVTGLVVVDTGTHFTLFGQGVLLVLIQCGGLGLMTFGVFLLNISGGQMTIRHRAALSEVLNQTGQGDMLRLLRWMLGFTFGMEILGTLVLAIHWVPRMGWSSGLYYSFFHAISAFNNAGFGLAADSLMGYVGNPLVNIVVSVLFIVGGIGFVVIVDVLNKRRFRDFALHTKVMLIGTVVINAIAMLMLLFLESHNPKTLGALPDLGDKLWAAWFQGVVPRTAGFNSVDIAAIYPATAFFMMGLMFIGGGSGSTASGIKLSTFIILLLATRTFLRQQERPVVLGRSISSKIVTKALATTIISLFCVMTGAFLLVATESGNFLDLAFEAVSAFGTVGMSRGVTADLSYTGQTIVMVLMLIGRVGPLTLAFLIANRPGDRIRYPDGQINVG
jgi:trk system potassium uptake protein TrkH